MESSVSFKRKSSHEFRAQHPKNVRTHHRALASHKWTTTPRLDVEIGQPLTEGCLLGRQVHRPTVLLWINTNPCLL
jgi:hypothetical protein